MAHKHIGRLVKKIVMCSIGERQRSDDASYRGVNSEISLFTIQKVIYLQDFNYYSVAICNMRDSDVQPQWNNSIL